jgi:hypothetical protein
MSSVDDSRKWEHGWAGHQREQLRRLARLTLAEKVQWLEESACLVQQLSRSARKDSAFAQVHDDLEKFDR